MRRLMRRSLSILPVIFCLMAGACAAADSIVDEEFLDFVRVVEDPDGYTNLRSSPSADGKIIDKVPSGGVVAIERDIKGGKWAEVVREEYKKPKAYIHVSRLRRLDKWKTLAVGDWTREKEASAKLDGVVVRVASPPFKERDYKITKDTNGGIRVNGMAPWGQDGGMPRTSLELNVSLNGRALKLPAGATRNLYDPNVGSLVLLTPSTADKHVLVAMMNGDGAGGYTVVWAFLNGAYVGRTVFVMF